MPKSLPKLSVNDKRSTFSCLTPPTQRSSVLSGSGLIFGGLYSLDMRVIRQVVSFLFCPDLCPQASWLLSCIDRPFVTPSASAIDMSSKTSIRSLDASIFLWDGVRGFFFQGVGCAGLGGGG